MTSEGGGFGFGMIFSYDPASANYKVEKSFDGSTGISPSGDLLEAADGKLYGMTSGGGSAGASSAGAIFSLDPANDHYSVLMTFTGSDGSSPHGSLIQGPDGVFYGMVLTGGNNNQGDLFSFVPSGAGGNYSILWSFNGGDGARPFGSVYLSPDNKLYGLTSLGGSFNGGVLFAFSLSKGPYAVLKNFEGFSGVRPGSRLVQANDGGIYGMTLFGGTGNTGVIYSYDPVTGYYSEKFDFGPLNGHPIGGLVQASDGKLYGTTDQEDIAGPGTIFSYDPLSGVVATVKGFNGIDGSIPVGPLIQATDDKLYGVTFEGGSNGRGVLYSFDPVSGAYSVLVNFDAPTVQTQGVSSGLVQASNGKLYGTVRAGGSTGGGAIYAYDPVAASFSLVKSLHGGNEGAFPTGGLIQASDGKLYGLAAIGGSGTGGQGNGVIFALDPSTSAYSVVWNFPGNTKFFPEGSLLQASDGKLYGMTDLGGANNQGIIFSWDVSSSTFSKIADLSVVTGNTLWDDDRFVELRKIKTLIASKGGYRNSEAVRVSFRAGGAYNIGNLFNAELSDSTGSFARPVVIGRASSRYFNGRIEAKIPANTPAGNRYRIRVVSTSPVVYGSDNGSDIRIIPAGRRL
jgi:uncharacterized repeat protein (TIGR03803 family)